MCPSSTADRGSTPRSAATRSRTPPYNGLGQDNERTLAQTFRIPLRDPNITVRHYLHVVYPVVIDAGDECGIGSRRSDASFSGT
jgi:hypothetical protein